MVLQGLARVLARVSSPELVPLFHRRLGTMVALDLVGRLLQFLVAVVEVRALSVETRLPPWAVPEVPVLPQTLQAQVFSTLVEAEAEVGPEVEALEVLPLVGLAVATQPA
jgi:hypothetical protein